MNLDEKQRQMGKDNFRDALMLTRRQLVPALITLPSVTAFYWGYERMKGSLVRAGLIGTGGQGRSHIDSLNPDYIKLVAISDIRPSMQKKARQSLEAKYGSGARDIELIEDYPSKIAGKLLNDETTALCTKIERDFLRTLLGGCSTPISALAELQNDIILFRGNIFSLDGKEKVEIEISCSSIEASELGTDAAKKLLNKGAAKIVESIRNAVK